MKWYKMIAGMFSFDFTTKTDDTINKEHNHYLNNLANTITKKEKQQRIKSADIIIYNKTTIFKPREKEEKYLIKQGDLNGRR